MPPQLAPTTEVHHTRLGLLFDYGLIIKVATGAFELVGALVIALVPPALVLRLADIVTQGELAQDPEDAVANGLLDAAQALAVSSHTLIVVYLALRGAVKLGLAGGILAGKKVAYPLFMLSLVLFGGYEAYRGIATHSFLLATLACFDGALLALTAYQYRVRHPASMAGSPH